MRARLTAKLGLGAALALALAAPALVLSGCQRGSGDAGLDAATPPEASPPEPSIAARRPTRRYFFAHVEGRCEVYFADGDVLSSPRSAPCPLDLFQGERIRLAGKTCMRESSDAERRVPVVCPDPLTNLEKQERAKGR
jgi:hypothetical protein